MKTLARLALLPLLLFGAAIASVIAWVASEDDSSFARVLLALCHEVVDSMTERA